MPRSGGPPAFHDLLGLRGEPSRLPGRAALGWSPEALTIVFEVEAEPPLVVDAASPFANDCVEAFLATPDEPWRYLELVVDAAGAVYAARVTNPDESRATWRVAPVEPPEGTAVAVRGDGPPRERKRWSASLSIPWPAIGVVPAPGAALRANLFRIGRGRGVRHLALSPPRRDAPPDFHVPSRFARLLLV